MTFILIILIGNGYTGAIQTTQSNHAECGVRDENLTKYLLNLISEKGTDLTVNIIKNNEVNLMRLLIDDGNYKLTVDDFLMAIKLNQTDKVKLLLDRWVINPSLQNNTAIILACENDLKDIVELLLDDYRVDPTIGNNEAVFRAYENGNYDVLKMLVTDKRVLKVPLDDRFNKSINPMIDQLINNTRLVQYNIFNNWLSEIGALTPFIVLGIVFLYAVFYEVVKTYSIFVFPS